MHHQMERKSRNTSHTLDAGVTRVINTISHIVSNGENIQYSRSKQPSYAFSKNPMEPSSDKAFGFLIHPTPPH